MFWQSSVLTFLLELSFRMDTYVDVIWALIFSYRENSHRERKLLASMSRVQLSQHHIAPSDISFMVFLPLDILSHYRIVPV